MASPFTLTKSTFLGQTHIPTISPSTIPSTSLPKTIAKFKLYEIMGGRGLCNGEQGLQLELQKPVTHSPPSTPLEDQPKSESSTADITPENAFEKELLGLTGGFPGGEKGLRNFIEKNPPPKKKTVAKDLSAIEVNPTFKKKMRAPELPLLMPGMIALVKNKNSPYYMYCGIVQRITDGKAGVLFEGGNWDRLISFRLDELERREKGPPMVSPRSVVLEALVDKNA